MRPQLGKRFNIESTVRWNVLAVILNEVKNLDPKRDSSAEFIVSLPKGLGMTD
jgi:hypothetical protein